MKIAFLFPGQGSQAVGMGRELSDRFPGAAQTFAEADEALGFPISKLCFEGPEEELRLTENTQPAIMTVSVAAWRVLASQGVNPAIAAGHSLGEWSAHVAAGTLSFADAVRAVKARGRAMQLAVPPGQGAMAAVLQLDPAQVAEACAEAAAETGLTVQAANLNSPGQTVISGAAAAVERASALCKARGARRAVTLPVSAPFHCALMQPAQEEVARVLGGLTLNDPAIPVAANVTGALVMTADAARDALIRQVTGAVRWVDCVKALVETGVPNDRSSSLGWKAGVPNDRSSSLGWKADPQVFIEVGPGKVLSGLMKQIDPAQKALNVEDAASLDKTLAELGTLTT